MPARVVARPQTRTQLQTGTQMAGDPATSRLLSDLGAAVQSIPVRDRVPVVVDLVVGDNKVNHGLGRPARGMTLTPTKADATFAWAMTASDERQATVTVVGTGQTKCPLEFW